MKHRELLRLLQDDGWRLERTTGGHLMYIHPVKRGPVVVPAGGKEGQAVPRGQGNRMIGEALLNES